MKGSFGTGRCSRAAWFRTFLVLLLTPVPAFAQHAAGLPSGMEELDAMARREIQGILTSTPIPSISLALVSGDEIIWADASGYANLHAKTPADRDTVYQTGSTFKFVAATAVMQLVERGAVDLDKPINAYLKTASVPDGSLEGRPITVRQILSHTSGLKGTAYTTPLWWRKLPRTPEEVLADLELRFRTGAYKYCNSCYSALGLLVEEVSDRDFQTYVVEEILRPLGSETEHPFDPDAHMVERMALPYERRGEGVYPERQVRYDAAIAGDMYMTASDMAGVLAAHLNGGMRKGKRILSPGSVQEMHRAQAPRGNYGLGLGVYQLQGRHVLAHAGVSLGFSSYLFADTDAGFGCYAMANGGGSYRDLEKLCRRLVSVMRAPGVEDRPPDGQDPALGTAPGTSDQQ